jgi:hypothetical protein
MKSNVKLQARFSNQNWNDRIFAMHYFVVQLNENQKPLNIYILHKKQTTKKSTALKLPGDR